MRFYAVLLRDFRCFQVDHAPETRLFERTLLPRLDGTKQLSDGTKQFDKGQMLPTLTAAAAVREATRQFQR